MSTKNLKAMLKHVELAKKRARRTRQPAFVVDLVGDHPEDPDVQDYSRRYVVVSEDGAKLMVGSSELGAKVVLKVDPP